MSKYYQLPAVFFENNSYGQLTDKAKLLYAFMYDRYKLSEQNGMADEYGTYIYYCISEITERLHCSSRTAIRLLSELELLGLIWKRRQGIGRPNKVYVTRILEYD